MKRIMLAVAGVALLAAPALADWSEDFQSYAVGSQIIGQGGWQGWDLASFPDAVVADDPAGVVGNKVLKEMTNNDIVHTYTEATSGSWVYQAKQYIPGSQQGKGKTSFILMNNYNDGGNKGWGLSLDFDLNANTVTDGEAGEGGISVVYDQWVTIRVEIDLETNFRKVFYNNTLVGVAHWYDAEDANHAKSVAAVDLWADAAGNPIYYDDLSLTPGTPPVFAGDNLTAEGSIRSRYLVNLGISLGDTVITGSSGPSGLYEISNSGGNAQAWWKINNINTGWNSSFVTFLGSNPDYLGYRFKMPATVNQIVWWNRFFGDGGTFAATPEVQYLDAANGTWQTISDVTWDRPYNTEWVANANGIRRYSIVLNSPPANVWGIRLIGDAKPGVDDITFDAAKFGLPGTGFLGATEITLYGSLSFGSLNMNTNLALGATPVASAWQDPVAHPPLINDGLYDGNATTFGSAIAEDWIGVTWPAPQNNVAAVGFIAKGFKDGGWIGTFNGPECGSNLTANLRVETTTDGTTWTPVTGLDLGRYPQDVKVLYTRVWGPTTGFLFRFDPVSNITGIRVIGDTLGYAPGDNNGFLGCREFEVYANQ